MVPPVAVSEGLPRPRRLAAVAALSFGTSLVIVDGAIANVALPTIAHDLRVENSAAVAVVTVYQLVLVMLLLPFSGVGEKIGLKRLYQIGQLVFTVATLLCFFANSLPFLLIARAAQATGAAAVMSVASALIRATYPPKNLGRGLGFNSVVASSSAALAPALGGLILGVAPWPWVFALALPLAVASLAFGRALPDIPGRDTPFDVLGAILCAATFGLVIGGLESAVHGDSPVVSAAVVLAGVALGILFVRRERGEPNPILPVDLLGQPVIALSTIGGFAAFIASMTLLLSLPFRLQHDFGFSPSEVGAMILPWPMTMMVVAPLAGTLSDRYPAGLLGGVGMVVAVIGLVCMAFLPAHPQWIDFAWRMALTGVGFGFFMSPNARLIIGSAPKPRVAAAGGMTSTIRLVGQTMGATVVAALLALGVPGIVPPLVAAGLALVAGVCSIARLNPALRTVRGEEADDVVTTAVG